MSKPPAKGRSKGAVRSASPGWDDAGPPPLVEAPPTLHTFGFIPDQPRRAVAPDSPAYASVVQLQGVRVGEQVPRTLGTGVFIGADFLLTAAHVLFDKANDVFGTARAGGYAGSVVVDSPVLTIPPGARVSTQFIAAGGYRANADPAFDLAVIRLAAAIPNARSLDPTATTSASLDQAMVMVLGYPGSIGQPLFAARGRCVGVAPSLIFHTADVSEGNSGGAVLAAGGETPSLVAIHRAGSSETPQRFGDSCGAVRLTQDAIHWIEGRKARL